MSQEDVANKQDDLVSDLSGANDMQMLTAEYRDGHLQIVEVEPFHRGDEMEGTENSILPDVIDSSSPLIMDADKKYVQLDLLNFSLVRCDNEDGEPGYRLIANSDLQENYQLINHNDEENFDLLDNRDGDEPKHAYELVSISDGEETYAYVENEESGNNTEDNNEGLVTCILQGEDQASQEEGETYVMVESENGPVMMLQSSFKRIHTDQPDPKPKIPEPKKEEKKLTAAQILDRAKRLRKARELKQILARSVSISKRRGRKPHTERVAADELLSSPNFRLYLYSCKQCDFKANAMGDLRDHRNKEHGVPITKKTPEDTGPRVPLLPCSQCAYKAHSSDQLLKHISDHHSIELITEEYEESEDEEDSSTLLVCSACGFQSCSERAFSHHVQMEHNEQLC